MKRSMIAAIAGLALGFGAPESARAATVTYYACVNDSTGAIEIVTATKACKTGSHRIQWNQTGRQGVQGQVGGSGPQGLAGAQGPAGPQGSQGTSGAQGSSGPMGPDGPQGPAAVITGYFAQNTNPAALGNQVVYLQTAAVQTAGTYYVNSTALVSVGPFNGIGIECWLNVPGQYADLTGWFGGPGQFGVVAIAEVLLLRSGDSIQLNCYSDGGTGDYVDNGALSAILIDDTSAAAERISEIHSNLGGRDCQFERGEKRDIHSERRL
jgi:hypothetical protein